MYNQFIIVDEDNKPMAWSGDQLCYCTTSDNQDTDHPVRVYSKTHAKGLIQKSRRFRKENGLTVTKYKLMPIVY